MDSDESEAQANSLLSPITAAADRSESTTLYGKLLAFTGQCYTDSDSQALPAPQPGVSEFVLPGPGQTETTHRDLLPAIP
jgi:hypothetical protein